MNVQQAKTKRKESASHTFRVLFGNGGNKDLAIEEDRKDNDYKDGQFGR